MALSPLMEQYLSVKEKYKDTIVFFRVGDFYEMFFDDAKLVSGLLELTLTGKDCGLPERAPMCGVPFHSAETYIGRLVQKGYRVAICEQTEDPAKAKGLVKRDVIRIVTPGTVTESSMLQENSNNFIACVFSDVKYSGLSFCDYSTGELYATQVENDRELSAVKDELLKYSPSELLLCRDMKEQKLLSDFVKDKLSAVITEVDETEFDTNGCTEVIIKQFSQTRFKKLELSDKSALISSLGALLSYLRETQKKGMERITDIEIYRDEQFVHLDYNTRRNLELSEPLNSKNKNACLLSVLDKTKTPMGRRLMKSIVEKPLLNMARIIKRRNAVSELFDNAIIRGELISALTGVSDIERSMTRIVYGSANARELRALCTALSKLPAIKESVKEVKSERLCELRDSIDLMSEIRELIDSSIVDDPPFQVREGGIIKQGYSPELDELRSDMTDSSSVMAQIELTERTRTGIPKLRIGYNRVFGYYIEVSNSFKEMVPDNYIRKQTLVNGERFITEELKDLEKRILGAKDRAYELEYALFDAIRKVVAGTLDRATATASAVAGLDVCASLAETAFLNNYCCPEFTLDGSIKLIESRHPVVESLTKGAGFVPNDVDLDMNDNRVAIITGPNMAGKSTYMRQTALIVLMAQMGSFVPAKSAELSLVDSVFTRIGASDDLSSGQSTFMVEMNEVAYILKHATPKSLLILDEIGRGTSTYDGMSIARAVLEYVADKKKLGAKTLFATHYHELTVLEDKLGGVRNYNIAAIKRGDDITFLRRIIPGAADESYGVEVAALAGLPESVIERAKKILTELEKGGNKTQRKKKKSDESEQLTLIAEETPLEKRIRSLDINTLTPMDSMNILFELIKLCGKE